MLYPPHAVRLFDHLSPEFTCDLETLKAAIAAARTFSVIHTASLYKVVIIVRADREYEVEKFERRRQTDIAGQAMWVISPEDLVLSKLAWAKDSRSELQFRDVRSIIALQPSLDWSYMNRWAQRLTVATLLAEVRS